MGEEAGRVKKKKRLKVTNLKAAGHSTKQRQESGGAKRSASGEVKRDNGSRQLFPSLSRKQVRKRQLGGDRSAWFFRGGERGGGGEDKIPRLIFSHELVKGEGKRQRRRGQEGFSKSKEKEAGSKGDVSIRSYRRPKKVIFS